MDGKLLKGIRFQQRVIKELQSFGYSKLHQMTCNDYSELVPDDMNSTISIDRKVYKGGKIEIEVTVNGEPGTDYESVIEPLVSTQIEILSSKSVDGFSIFPNGSIEQMHSDDVE